jgi:serine phosphatase RsbU (regulator of sigma subunit)
MIIDASLLKRIFLFSALPEAERAQISEALHLVEYPAKAIICCEGEPGDRMFWILSGEVEVIKALGAPGERVFGTISAGDYVGEMALLELHGRRTATVRAAAPVTLLEMTRTDFDSLLARWPKLAMDMLRELSLRLRDTQSATIRDLQEKNIQLAEAYRELQAAQAQIIEKERLERELQVAQQIQMSMLPDALPETRGFEFGARILPARAIGGDLYDFIPLVELDTIGVLIGDVSDKGVPAALFMALTRSLLRVEATRGSSPAEVLEQVNHHLLEMNKSSMFVTMLYGILAPETGEFVYARAGHEVPILVRPDGKIQPIKHDAGQLIGIFSQPLLDEQCVAIPKGGALLLYTDGATDASRAPNDFFGSERLEAVLQKHREGTAQEICDKVFAEILQFQGAAPQIDDITLVVIRSR